MGCWLIQNVSPIHLKSPNAWSWKEDVGAQLVERDHAEGRCLPLSSQDTPHSIFLICRFSSVGDYLGHCSGGGHPYLTTSTNEHFSHFSCRNSKYITSEMLLPWQTGHTTGRYMFRPMSAEEEFHAALLNFGVSEVPTQTAEEMVQHPCPPSLHGLHCHPTLFIHPQINQRGKTQGFTSLHTWVRCIRKAKHIFPEFCFRGQLEAFTFIIFVVQDWHFTSTIYLGNCKHSSSLSKSLLRPRF